jgi:hypothetical protein
MSHILAALAILEASPSNQEAMDLPNTKVFRILSGHAIKCRELI